MDRAGANYERVAAHAARRSSATTPVMLQVPIGAEDQFQGIIDLDHDARPSTSTATTARTSARRTIPAEYVEEAKQRRAEHDRGRRRRRRRARPRSSSTTSQSPTTSSRAAIRRATLALKMTPGHVRLGLQEQGRAAPARRRVPTTCRTRPRSSTRRTTRRTTRRRSSSSPTRTSRSSAWRSSSRTAATASSPTCASTRARSPRATSSSTSRTRRRCKIPRIVRMHSDEMNDIDEADGRRHRRPLRRRVRLGRHVHRRHGQRTR